MQIGEGLQFKVYAGGYYVFKQLKTHREMNIYLLKRPWRWYTLFFNIIHSRDITGLAFSRFQNVFNEVQKSKIPGHIFANISVQGNFYRQRRCELIKSFTTQKQVDDFIELNLTLWEYGFFEYVFNFHRNCGYLGNEMVLFDFGEMMLDKAEAIEKMRQKPWFKSLSYRFHISKDIKPYYDGQCKKYFTKGIMNKLWRSRC